MIISGTYKMGVNKNRICVNYLRKRVYTFGHQSQPFRWNESISPENKVNLFRNSNAHSDYAYAYAYKICTHMVTRERC